LLFAKFTLFAGGINGRYLEGDAGKWETYSRNGLAIPYKSQRLNTKSLVN